ncbi:hypothetical protein PoB_000567000 [Plakobranchus ocellatus]|uniref:Uncharacterized protein n=1 Tax=Plakobranchus ocellatus TaxID=259542 RepID=A0AAV3Y9H4_9GAST|nr:hypothetical protein PoB_000567000 [Plakobranchus ocellatus]
MIIKGQLMTSGQAMVRMTCDQAMLKLTSDQAYMIIKGQLMVKVTSGQAMVRMTCDQAMIKLTSDQALIRMLFPTSSGAGMPSSFLECESNSHISDSGSLWIIMDVSFRMTMAEGCRSKFCDIASFIDVAV